MNIEEMLDRVKQAREVQEKEAADGSTIPQELMPDPKNCVPKNIEADGEDGDPSKIEKLLASVAAAGETGDAEKGAAEAILMGKLAEQSAEQDMDMISKQASYFGAEMADAMMARIAEHNDAGQMTEKEASDAQEAQLESWYTAGAVMAEGYLDKFAASANADAVEGVVNPDAVPAQVNQDEETERALAAEEMLADEIAQEIVRAEGGNIDPKEAAEKFAGAKDIVKSIYAKARGMSDHARIKGMYASDAMKARAGKLKDKVYKKPGTRTVGPTTGAKITPKGSRLYEGVQHVGRNKKKYIAGGVVGAGGAAYGGNEYRKSKAASEQQQENILAMYADGVLDKEAATAALTTCVSEDE